LAAKPLFLLREVPRAGAGLRRIDSFLCDEVSGLAAVHIRGMRPQQPQSVAQAAATPADGRERLHAGPASSARGYAGNGVSQVLSEPRSRRQPPPLAMKSIRRDPGRSPPAPPTPPPATVLLLGERDRRLYVLRPEKIDYVEADGNYVKFHIVGLEYIARDSVKRLASALVHMDFVRIERSLLLNLRAISYVQRIGRGTYAFTLVSGACLRSGATYREHILRALPLA
jgi:LytTr DNA-binding domain